MLRVETKESLLIRARCMEYEMREAKPRVAEDLLHVLFGIVRYDEALGCALEGQGSVRRDRAERAR